MSRSFVCFVVRRDSTRKPQVAGEIEMAVYVERLPVVAGCHDRVRITFCCASRSSDFFG